MSLPRVSLNRAAIGTGTVLAVVALLAIVSPALFSSITADDSHWILETPAHTGGSYWQAIVWSFSDIPSQSPDQGRFSQFAYAMQRVIDITTMDAAVALSLPPLVIRAAIKVALLVTNLFVIRAFLRSFRGRTNDGRIVALPRGATTLAATALTVLIVLGAKTQELGSFNGWLHYPVLTYGSVAVIFGGAALVLWLYRKLSENWRRYLVPTLVVALFSGVFWATSYELFYLAFPLCVAALAVQPRLSTSEKRPWLPKAVSIGALSVIFVVSLAATRIYIAAACAAGGCYEGIVFGSIPGTISTTVHNVLGSLPWSSSAFSGVAPLGFDRALPPRVTPWSILLGGVLALGVFLVLRWRWQRRGVAAADAHDRNSVDRDSAERSAQRRILLWSGALSLAVALGAAIVMSLSVKSQQSIEGWGVPYRNGVLTWTSLCITLICALWYVALLPRVRSWARARTAFLAGFATVCGVIAMTTAPFNYFTAQNSRLVPATQLVDTIHYQVAVGDLSPRGDAARCEVIADYTALKGEDLHGIRTIAGAYSAFQHYYGVPFCSEYIGPWDAVPTEIY